MIGDPAGGDTYDDSLNKILAKSAFCRATGPLGKNGACDITPTAWHDGTPMAESPPAPPPLQPGWTFDTPPGAAAFYKQPALKRAHAKKFADAGSPGAVYAAQRERCRAALRWAHAPHPALSSEDGAGTLLPAFYRTLDCLHRSGRSFSVVLRTFGSDLPRVQAAINAFARGEHPDYPEGAPGLELPAERMWRGRYDEGGRFSLQPHDEGSGAPTITDEAEAVRALSSPGVSGVMDHYGWWDSHGNDPAAGKPLWLTLEEATTRHLFFDDNIHNDPQDSIVSVRARRDGEAAAFSPLSGAQICSLHGAVLRRVPTMQPVLEPDWFLAEIEACGERLAQLRRGQAWADLLST